MRFVGAGLSDVGLIREANEDSAVLGPRLALVADGVGGAAAGEVASACAAHAVLSTVAESPGKDPLATLSEAFGAAQRSVQVGIQHDLDRLGMATTLTAVVSDGDRLGLGHVGDSRAYALSDGVLTQLTSDHTYVQRLVEQGTHRADELSDHPWRNVVLRSVDGDPAAPAPDLIRLDLVAGDRLLICSDGLTDMVSEEDIAAAILGVEPGHAVRALVDLALEAGGSDNITAVVVDLAEDPPYQESQIQTAAEATLLGAVGDSRNTEGVSAVEIG